MRVTPNKIVSTVIALGVLVYCLIDGRPVGMVTLAITAIIFL